MSFGSNGRAPAEMAAFSGGARSRAPELRFARVGLRNMYNPFVELFTRGSGLETSDSGSISAVCKRGRIRVIEQSEGERETTVKRGGPAMQESRSTGSW